MRSSLWATALALATSLAAAPQAVVAADAPPSVTAFFKRPQLREPRLSPSGRYLAIQAAARNDRMALAVLDLQTMAAPKFIAGFSDADIAEHHWVSEDRLVYSVSDSPDGSTRVMAEGLWAVERDGSQPRQLIHSQKSFIGTATNIADRRLDINWTLHTVPPDDSDEVLVMRQPWRDDTAGTGAQLSRLNTRTGHLRNLNLGLPSHVVRWVLDWRGEPYAVEAFSEGRSRFHRRDDEGRWQPWFEDDGHARRRPLPRWIAPGGQVYGVHGHRGHAALFRLDPQTGDPEPEPLLTTAGYDFDGRLLFDAEAGRLLGIRYETDAVGTAWLDPAMKAMQADIDAKLPGSVNVIGCRRCLKAMHIIVTALSDQRPPEYHLYKPADRSLQKLAGAPAELRVSAMGQRDYHRVRARDGLELPVLVTQPVGGVKGRRAPTVVLVHGGPYVRGTHWAWERNAQFLASRGYLVLEPEFRGSTGYGGRLYRAGWKQWGLAMQDDLADTLAWAVKQGWADPDRACIAGASYGGYAALMGAITQGELFKCAISWVGVTDIGLMSSIHWSDLSDEWKQHGMKRLVADPATDAEQMQRTSPLRRAGEIRMPLLLAYGAEDQRVPLRHGTEFKAALRADQPLEWVVYPDEGHGWFNLKTNEDFWGRVERFLARHLARQP